MTYAMYGQNPNAYLAQTPYARMTGLVTQVDPYQIPNAYSYLQPTFVDMNAYRTSGLPEYPSFIGGTALMNPQIPIAQPGQYNQQSYYPQQGYGYQQPSYGYQQPSYGYQQPAFSQPGQYYQQQTTVLYGQAPQFPSPAAIGGGIQSLVSSIVSGLDSIILA
ncbi:MAG: hypothetical protein GX568_10435 [Candidatus Gastranaerophilales bacterium]|jgi:hypothetical protein|nr:hypothetical protein [Candidatus Gastranaerophilales bacterium]